MPIETCIPSPADSAEPTVTDGPVRELPCHRGDPDLWFADAPSDLERAKSLCAPCPIRELCLSAALDREEPWGVWGGEILDRGAIVARKRPRGRPRKNHAPDPARELVCA